MVLILNSQLIAALCLKASLHSHLENCFISASSKGNVSKTPGPSLQHRWQQQGIQCPFFSCFHVKPKCPRDMAGPAPDTWRRTQRWMQIRVISQLVLPCETYGNSCYTLHKASVEIRFTIWMFGDGLFLKPKIAS